MIRADHYPETLALAAFTLATLARPARAATIAVTTTADEDNANGACSLHEAIIAANTDATRGGCPVGTGGAKDEAGNALAKTYSWTFTTGGS